MWAFKVSSSSLWETVTWWMAVALVQLNVTTHLGQRCCSIFFFLLSSSVGHLLSQFMSHVRKLISFLFISPISSPQCNPSFSKLWLSILYTLYVLPGTVGKGQQDAGSVLRPKASVYLFYLFQWTNWGTQVSMAWALLCLSSHCSSYRKDRALCTLSKTPS